jgi:hypothetical protein
MVTAAAQAVQVSLGRQFLSAQRVAVTDQEEQPQVVLRALLHKGPCSTVQPVALPAAPGRRVWQVTAQLSAVLAEPLVVV